MAIKTRKSTEELVKELGLCSDFKSFYKKNENNMVSQSLSELLDSLMVKKNLRKSQVIRDSELSEIYAYQIFSGRRMPDRKKLLSLAVGMGLNIEETQTLLKCAGFPPLYVKLPFDSVVLYGIYKKMTVLEINKLLFDYSEDTLG